MSPSNEAETWESIRALAGLTSLVEIVVVQSTRVEVQVFRREAGGAWPSDPETSAVGATIRLASIGLDLPVAEVYRGTHLAQSEDGA
jgi:Uma2 family endonuclease